MWNSEAPSKRITIKGLYFIANVLFACVMVHFFCVFISVKERHICLCRWYATLNIFIYSICFFSIWFETMIHDDEVLCIRLDVAGNKYAHDQMLVAYIYCFKMKTLSRISQYMWWTRNWQCCLRTMGRNAACVWIETRVNFNRFEKRSGITLSLVLFCSLIRLLFLLFFRLLSILLSMPFYFTFFLLRLLIARE